MAELQSILVKNVSDKFVRKVGDTTGRDVAEKAVKEAFGKDVKSFGAQAVAKAGEVAELPKLKIKNPVQRVVGSVANIDAPRVSPNKQTVTYVVRETKDIPTFMKWLLGLDTKEPTERMTAWVAPANAGAGAEPQRIAGRTFHNVVEPSFTPDGKSIIYCEQKNLPFLARGEKLKEMRLDQRNLITGEVKTIYDGELTLLHPMYSPDGKTIVAYSRNIKGQEGLYTLDVTKPGAKPVRITAGDDKHPVWSEDGKKIFFHNQVGGDANGAAADGAEFAWLGMVDMADPKNPKRIMLDDTNDKLFHKHPTPLPNSDLVVYHSTADDKTKLEVLNTVTGQRARLDLDGMSPNGTELKKFKHAQFSNDGSELYFVGKGGKTVVNGEEVADHADVYKLPNAANQILEAFRKVFPN